MATTQTDTARAGSSAGRRRGRARLADPQATEFLRAADPVMAGLIDARPDFRPRASMMTPPATMRSERSSSRSRANSCRSRRRARSCPVSRSSSGGRLPSPAELLASDPQVVRDAGLSWRREEATLRAIAERFVDGRLSDETLARMSDDEVEAALTEVPGVGPWTAHGFLARRARSARRVARSRSEASGRPAGGRARRYGLEAGADRVRWWPRYAERWRPVSGLLAVSVPVRVRRASRGRALATAKPHRRALTRPPRSADRRRSARGTSSSRISFGSSAAVSTWSRYTTWPAVGH